MEMRADFSTIMEKCAIMYIGRGGVPLKYKKAIIEIVEKIHSEKILKRIYDIVLYLYTTE